MSRAKKSMANFEKHHRTQPSLAFPGHYIKTDGHVPINVVPCYRPEPPKPASKCLYYTVTIFAAICITLSIFFIVILPTKSLPLRITSPSLESLNYHKSPSPSFSGSISAGILIQNPNFGPFRLQSATLSFNYGDSTVGASNAVEWKKNFVVKELHEDLIKLDVSMKHSSDSMKDVDRDRLGDELSSGILKLKGFVRVDGEIVLFKRFMRKTSGQLDCDAYINLGTHQLIFFVCS